MNISTRRFNVRTSDHVAIIRDRNAPYHPHCIPAGDLPSAEAAAMMTEEEYDRVIFDLIYRSE